MSHKPRKSVAQFELGVGTRKKDRTGKSHIKICSVGDVLDIITCAKFQKEIFRGYDFRGGRIFHFPIDFRMGLTTVQRYRAACDSDPNLLLT